MRKTLTMGVVVVLLVGLVGLAVASERPSFCAGCHEIAPFVDAWSAGPHAAEAECISCHVEPGIWTRVGHKLTALGEVASHLRGDVTFPRAGVVTVPDSRCIACHESVETDSDFEAFSHEDHAATGSCQSCHAMTGHAVSDDALAAAGVLDEETAQKRLPVLPEGVTAFPGAGRAAEGHPETTCASCHDIAATGCLTCHAAALPDEHPDGDTCATCHPDTATWAYVHPDREPCAECHTRPAEEDHPERDDCGTCHSTTGKWAHDR